jgi:hypothetical protein
MSPSLIIRPAARSDDDAIWRVLEPILRAGETYPLPRDISPADAFTYWRAPGHEVYVAEEKERELSRRMLKSERRRCSP